MPESLSPKYADRSSIVTSLFIDTADQNYVVARWCYLNSLFLDFYWNGAHAVEKYIKAALLLNDRSSISPKGKTKSFRHDIKRLYEELRSFADDLLPLVIPKPNELNMPNWWSETMTDFVKRLSGQGDAHNRYQIFGYVQHREDLYKLDRLVFAVRRLCCPLNAYYHNNITFREVLTKQPELQPKYIGTRWEKLIGKNSSDAVRDAALKHNVLFAPEDYQHGSLRDSLSSSNSVLWRRVLLPAEQGKSGLEARNAVRTLDWVIENIQLPPAVKSQLLNARKQLATP